MTMEIGTGKAAPKARRFGIVVPVKGTSMYQWARDPDGTLCEYPSVEVATLDVVGDEYVAWIPPEVL